MKRLRFLSLALVLVLVMSFFSVSALGYDQQETTREGRIKQFVGLLYNELLKRQPAVSERDHWYNLLNTGAMTGREAAYSFVAGPEFALRRLTDEEYIVTLYHGLLGRGPVQSEVTYWVNLVPSLGRIAVLNEFLNSLEFQHIMAWIGIS